MPFRNISGHVSKESVEWIAAKLDLRPINVYELVTFCPMFREEPAGHHDQSLPHAQLCFGGVGNYTVIFCQKLGLDPKVHGLQTSKDGKFSVEIVVSGQLRDGSCHDVQRGISRASALIRLTRSWTNVHETHDD